MNARRKQQLEQTVARLRARYGERAIRRAAQLEPQAEAATLSTGFAAIDRLLGDRRAGGGLVRGHIVELLGWGTAGHVTLAARVLGLAQAAGLSVVYVDALQAIDLDLLARWGVAPEALVVLRPLSWGHGIEMTRDLLRTGAAGVVVLDRLQPAVASGAALQAFSDGLAEWNGLLSRTMSTLLVISEAHPQAHSLATYPYGPTLPHFSYTRLAFRWRHWLYRRRRCTGFVSQVTVLKHRAGPSGATCRIEVALCDDDASRNAR